MLITASLLLKLWALDSPSSNPVSLVGRFHSLGKVDGAGIPRHSWQPLVPSTSEWALRQEGADVPDLSWEFFGLSMS